MIAAMSGPFQYGLIQRRTLSDSLAAEAVQLEG